MDFAVAGSVQATGSCITAADGTCTFTYEGPATPGADTITAETPGATLPGTATKVWLPLAEEPPMVPAKCTGGGHILHRDKVKGASFGFNAKIDGLRTHGSGNFIDHRTKTKIHLLDVTHLVIVGTRATFHGNARIDGVHTTYQIANTRFVPSSLPPFTPPPPLSPFPSPLPPPPPPSPLSPFHPSPLRLFTPLHHLPPLPPSSPSLLPLILFFPPLLLLYLYPPPPLFSPPPSPSPSHLSFQFLSTLPLPPFSSPSHLIPSPSFLLPSKKI